MGLFFSICSIFISLFSVVFAFSAMKISLFNQQYLIYELAEDYFSKLVRTDYTKIYPFTENDLIKIQQAISKSYFLFRNDKDIEKELNFIKDEIIFNLENPCPKDHIPQNFEKLGRHSEKIQLELDDKKNKFILKKVFEPYLSLNIFIYWICRFFKKNH